VVKQPDGLHSAGGGGRSFADVLNNLGGDSGRMGGHRTGRASSSATQEPIPVQPAGSDGGEQAPLASVVRPYTWTKGRTSPVFDLEVETLVSTSDRGHGMAVLTSAEHRAVADLCRGPRSVAEVAALLSLPLGVARVLLADMAGLGLIVVHRNANSSGDMPGMALMERVLSGLRRL
jgi:uncharacterized protein DUF742